MTVKCKRLCRVDTKQFQSEYFYIKININNKKRKLCGWEIFQRDSVFLKERESIRYK